MFWGVLSREGMRRDEAVGLDWVHIDLVRGVVRLDTNKTDDPRVWKLSPDVHEALKKWHALRDKVEPTDPVFTDMAGKRLKVDHAADVLRAHLVKAGVKRDELFRSTAHRQALRAHDLRATFVTVSLSAGRSERWISDRTGHKSSQMIHLYYRQARTFAELGIGSLAPMDSTIPEFVAPSWPRVAPLTSDVPPVVEASKLLNY